MGEASAAAQGLTKPITTAERLRNSEHSVYLLIDQNAGNGRGAVTGMLKTGMKGLYVFDRNGQHYQVSPPCVLDFYVHESRQRTGLGKRLFEHMLQTESIEPVKMAIDRPSEKFLGFLNKHYSLNNPVKQMNNYVVFDGFFPGAQDKNGTVESHSSHSNTPVGKKQSANGLQTSTYASPLGRYGAPRPPCSMGQIIHNQTSTIAKTPEPTGVRSAPETNYQSVTTNSPNISQSTPNMYYQKYDGLAPNAEQMQYYQQQQQSNNVWQQNCVQNVPQNQQIPSQNVQQNYQIPPQNVQETSQNVQQGYQMTLQNVQDTAQSVQQIYQTPPQNIQENYQIPSQNVQETSQNVQQGYQMPSHYVQAPSQNYQIPSQNVQATSQNVQQSYNMPSYNVQAPSQSVQATSQSVQQTYYMPSQNVQDYQIPSQNVQDSQYVVHAQQNVTQPQLLQPMPQPMSQIIQQPMSQPVLHQASQPIIQATSQPVIQSVPQETTKVSSVPHMSQPTLLPPQYSQSQLAQNQNMEQTQPNVQNVHQIRPQANIYTLPSSEYQMQYTGQQNNDTSQPPQQNVSKTQMKPIENEAQNQQVDNLNGNETTDQSAMVNGGKGDMANPVSDESGLRYGYPPQVNEPMRQASMKMISVKGR
ncbi:alpha-tubulin N-acetyltransferase isoform X2 [Tribolium castaneum]|nr:PREDICTED: alpha-tubulin N-acetyltransferase isoform X2 [Tribolium castaneum]|eukprot:XP_015832979.1 PREDICTED: alpha-tubulin N-acetyltransferase isoform X2 [Tribolium castaneum]